MQTEDFFHLPLVSALRVGFCALKVHLRLSLRKLVQTQTLNDSYDRNLAIQYRRYIIASGLVYQYNQNVNCATEGLMKT